MRITETSSNFKSAKVKKAKDAKQADFLGLLNTGAADDVSETSASGEVESVANLNSLNSLSFSSDFSERETQKMNLKYGKDMLKSLELLKKAIILGALEYNTLHNISERLNIIPVEPADLELKSLIEEIRTRASVEIEKLKKTG